MRITPIPPPESQDRPGYRWLNAHLGTAIQTAEADRVMVLTSDPDDMRKAAEGRQVNVVAL
jgi:hypothetical protein